MITIPCKVMNTKDAIYPAASKKHMLPLIKRIPPPSTMGNPGLNFHDFASRSLHSHFTCAGFIGRLNKLL